MTQEETVFQYIEKAILERRLLPGTRLREVKLAEIFGVKRGLIRKVLTHLTHAKLVEHKPHIGAQVACPSIEDAQDLFYTRSALENAVLKLLCEKKSKHVIQELKNHCLQEQQAYQDNDPQQGVRLSADFHRMLSKLAGNKVLEDFLNTVINRTPFVIMPDTEQPNVNGCFNHDHSDIVTAIENQDFKQASDLMKHHLQHMETLFHSKPTSSNTPLEQVFDL